MRPVILTGIEDVVTRNDLVDRSLSPHLPVIEESKRRQEREFWDDFDRSHPSLLGALLSVVAEALKRLPHVKPSKLPRMADFAIWGEAVSQAIGGQSGEFFDAYGQEIRQAHETILEESPVAQEITAFLAGTGKTTWEGTVRELLGELANRASEATRRSHGWPKSPRGLSGILRRLAPSLRTVGLQIEFPDRTTLARTMRIQVAPRK
jgi:hypothetical protein